MAGLSLNKLDAYRIADPTFRVHSRLFWVQDAVIKSAFANLRATKASSIGLAGVTTSIFIAIVAMLPEKTSYIIPIAILIVSILLWNVWETWQRERCFGELIKEIGGEEVEKWVGYITSVIAAYTTRIRMIEDAIEELELLRRNGEIDDNKYSRDKKYCETIRSYSIDRLKYFDNQNEELYKSKKRSEEDYNKVKYYLAYYSEIKQGVA